MKLDAKNVMFASLDRNVTYTLHNIILF